MLDSSVGLGMNGINSKKRLWKRLPGQKENTRHFRDIPFSQEPNSADKTRLMLTNNVNLFLKEQSYDTPT